MNVVLVGGTTYHTPAGQFNLKLCCQCGIIKPADMFTRKVGRTGMPHLHSWCKPCLLKRSAASARKYNKWMRQHRKTERGKHWVKVQNRYRHSPKGQAMRRRERERMMADPTLRAKHQEAVRRSSGHWRAIRRLMLDLYGACHPRPHCSNHCQGPHYKIGRKRASYRMRYCIRCASVTGDVYCTCCWDRTRFMHNQAAHLREMWAIAEDVELTIMLGGMLGEPVEVSG